MGYSESNRNVIKWNMKSNVYKMYIDVFAKFNTHHYKLRRATIVTEFTCLHCVSNRKKAKK